MSLAALVLVYVGACIWLWADETRLAFNRRLPFVPPWPSLALNQQQVAFGDLAGVKTFAWFVSSMPADNADYWLIFFHGTGDNVSLSSYAYDRFRSMGFNVMAPEYPGYIGLPGVPSEAGIQREALAAYQYLRTVKRVPAKNIVIFGASLGSAFAIDLASRVDAGALIVVSALSSGVAMGQKMFPFLPVRMLLRNRFESENKIGLVKMPVLVMHSVDDRRMPIAEHGQRLYDLARSPKQLIKIRGEHGESLTHAIVNPAFFADIVSFLNSRAGFRLHPPLPSIAPVVVAAIDSFGIQGGVERYRSLRAEIPWRYNFREPELEHLGDYFLEQRKTNEALAVFLLNAETFPQSFRVFDSLGDAYAASGKSGDAVRSYRQSLDLVPVRGDYVRAKLDRLTKAGI